MKPGDVCEHDVRVNGVRIHYAMGGKGKSVVLLHGNGESHDIFLYAMDRLMRAGYQAVAPDSRGHGESESVEEYHYAEMAEDVWQLMQALKLSSPAVYGFSDGGIIALELAIHHPGCAALLAVSGANLFPEGLCRTAIDDMHKEMRGDHAALIRLMLEEPHIDPQSLKAIRAPVLVTAGEHDMILESHTRLIAASLPNVELHLLAGETHDSYIERQMPGLLLSFLHRQGY